MSARSTKKTTATKKVLVKDELVKAEVKFSKPMFGRQRFTLLLALIIAGGLLYLMRSYFVAAVVNGRPISRFSLLQQLEKSQGSQMLETLVIEELIRQEAKKNGVAVSPEELQTKISSIETEVSASGQNIDELLVAQGMTRDSFSEQVKLQLMLEKLVANQSPVTEEEIAKYISENETYFPSGITDEEKHETAISQIDQQRASEAIQTLIARLQSEADVQYWVSYQPTAAY